MLFDPLSLRSSLETGFFPVAAGARLLDGAGSGAVTAVEGSRGKESSRIPRSSVFTALAGWILLVALVYAPWAFNSRTYLLADGLAAQLVLAGIAWIIGLVYEHRWPKVPVSTILGIGFLVGMMWLGLWNAASEFDPATERFIPTSSLNSLPSNVDARNGLSSAVCLSSILLTIAVATDLATNEMWRRRMLLTIGWTGFSVILFGLILKTGVFPATEHWLAQRPWSRGDVFGPLDYHGNVATLINLALPALAFQAALARTTFVRALMISALGVMLLAVSVNLSRTGFAIAAVLACAITGLIARAWGKVSVDMSPAKNHRLALLAISLACLLSLAAVAVTGRAQSIARLETLSSEIANPWNARYLQSRAAWEMVIDRPYYGAGVGSYKLLVQQSAFRGDYFAGRFHPGDAFTVLNHHVQNDYLQTLVEWGGIGFSAWAVLVGGAFFSLLKSFWQVQPPFLFLSLIALALSAVYLHAIVDCPLQIPGLQLYTAVYLGLACSLRNPANSTWAGQELRQALGESGGKDPLHVSLLSLSGLLSRRPERLVLAIA